MVLHMCYVPYFADIQGPDQWRAGRRRLLQTSFGEFEENVRGQLDQALSGAGFDAGRDIQAITVNRWAHGYSYSPGLTWEPDYASEADKPWVKGRKRSPTPAARMMALRIRSEVAPAALVAGTRGVLLVILSIHVLSMTRTWDLS